MKNYLKITIFSLAIEFIAFHPTVMANTDTIIQKEADTVKLKEIVVKGSGRLSDVAIIALMSFRDGDDISKADEASIVKELYESQKFKSVKVSLDKDILNITVVENSIINNFIFEGNKVVKENELLSVVGVKIRSISTRSTKGTIVSNLRKFYKMRGFYDVKIKAKEIKLSNNRIDYSFTIEEGGDSTIKSITFTGNKYYDDDDLRDVILSKEDAWYRFLSDSDIFNKGRLEADKQYLINFYKNRGFVDFKVEDIKSTLSKSQKDFHINFTVKEGKRYKLGEVKIVGANSGMDMNRLNDLLVGGDNHGYYYAKGLQSIIVSLSRELSKQGFSFISVNPKLIRSVNAAGEDVMNLDFELVKSRPLFIEKIIIRNNTRTLDSVIRREFELVEGDAFNAALMNQSEQNIRGLRFFSNVKTSFVKGSSEDRVIIYVDVVEQSTGSLAFGAAFSNTTGFGFKISASENNFLGKGQKANLELEKKGDDVSIDLSFTEPRFLGRDLLASVVAEKVYYDNSDTQKYKAEEMLLSGTLSYKLNEKWTNTLSGSINSYNLYDVEEGAAASVIEEAGRSGGFDFGTGLSYSNLDDPFNPKSGQKFSAIFSLDGLDSIYANNVVNLNAKFFYPVNENVVLTFNAHGTKIFGYNQLRVSDRLYLNSDYIRGFDVVGPMDSVTGTLLGGATRFTVGSELDFPIGLSESAGVKGSLFIGAASLTDIPTVSSNVKLVGNDIIRSSTGLGIKWQSPIGAMRFDFIKVLSKAETDITDSFQFSVGFGF